MIVFTTTFFQKLSIPIAHFKYMKKCNDKPIDFICNYAVYFFKVYKTLFIHYLEL